MTTPGSAAQCPGCQAANCPDLTAHTAAYEATMQGHLDDLHRQVHSLGGIIFQTWLRGADRVWRWFHRETTPAACSCPDCHREHGHPKTVVAHGPYTPERCDHQWVDTGPASQTCTVCGSCTFTSTFTAQQ